MTSNASGEFPEFEKFAFLELAWKQEDECEAETDDLIPNMGVRAPACLEQVGTVLSLLDRMATCWWVCRRGDHLVEYLCGRVVSNARATLRMLRFGFYDEALLLCRAMGETSNLLQLFATDKESLRSWKSASRSERIREFGPAKVRIRLEKQTGPSVNKERYRLLSERAAHVTPDTKPQSHNALGMPTAVPIIQEAGLLVCLNELALALSTATAFGALVLELDDELRKRITSEARALIENIGGATITEIDEYHRRVMESSRAQEHRKYVAEMLRRIHDDRRNS